MLERFTDKVVFVTGAASGIGHATCIRLAEEGANIVCSDVNNVEGIVAKVKELGRDAIGFTCDVSDEEAVVATVKSAMEHFDKLDVLCNVAGIMRSDHTHELAFKDWKKILAVNVDGTFLMTRECLPHLLKRKGSNVVNISSTAALGSHPWMAAYAASKGGILSFTRSIAVEYVKQGLRANAICPGGIATPFHAQFKMPKGGDMDLLKGAMPFMKYAGPEHVASTIAFVASDDARYMTGAEIRVDGGALS